jgi:hypothetical protein
VAQLDDVHSVLRLNYEALKELISLSLDERRKYLPFVRRAHVSTPEGRELAV